MNCPSCSLPIDQHEAGRSTDRCVAEARGWKYAQKSPKENWCQGETYGVKKYDGGWWYSPDNDYWICACCEGEPYPHFSTSFADCEGLIEELEMETRHFDFYYSKRRKRWGAVVVGYQKDIPLIHAPTLPHAISLAYLAYAGQKGGE